MKKKVQFDQLIKKQANSPLSSVTGQELTDKFRRSKDVLELISSLNLMCNPKINKFDSRVGDIFVQQHDVFRLKDKMIL